jgi:transcriptional regulator NrdR family protein
MEDGYYYVAKEYIIYRQKRIEEREKEKAKLEKKLMGHKLKVIKSDGKKEVFDMNKVRNTFDRIVN